MYNNQSGSQYYHAPPERTPYPPSGFPPGQQYGVGRVGAHVPAYGMMPNVQQNTASYRNYVPQPTPPVGYFYQHAPPPPPPPMAPYYAQQPIKHFGAPRPREPVIGQPRYGAPQGMQSRPAPKRRFEFFCESCTKGFECEEDYDIHVAEDHVTCPHPGCGFSAREDVVRAHKVKHTVNTESEEEINAWIAMRRFKFPRKDTDTKPVEEPKTVSKLEQFIRGSIRQSRIEARKRRLEREQKQPCIHWERTGKCKFGDTCSFAHEKQGVCTFFVNHGRCRHGDACKYKHVRAGSGEIEELRNPHGGLLKKLLSVETTRFENKILQVLRHMVNNKFYQEGAQIEAEPEEEDLGSELDVSDDGDFSPISNR